MTEHEDVGYLTWEEWRRFRIAVDRSLIVVPWFRVAGYIKSDINEIRSPSSSHPLGVPPTWLAAEEITRLQRELDQWDTPEQAVNDDYGWSVALTFTREVETAMARWPVEDKPRQVRYMRCQECAGETIKYDPPAFDGDKIRIACTECGHPMTEDEFSLLATLVAEEIKRTEKAIGGTRRVGAA